MVFELDQYSPIKYLFVFHLFAVVYWFVTIYLVFIHPFFESARKSVKCFWVGHYAFYFQLVCVLSGMTTFFYFELDYLMNLLNISHLRFFGLSFNFFSSFDERKNRFSVYVGKFSNLVSKPIIAGNGFDPQAEDPLIFCSQFIQIIIYLAATVLSLLPGGMKAAFVSMRLGCTVCFGVQLAFRGTYSVMHFFGKSSDGILGVLSLIFGILMVLLPIVDSLLMKMQAGSLNDGKSGWSVPKSKGALIFDINGFTGHKKYRDYYPFFLTEHGLGLATAMLIPILSFSDIIQNIVFIVIGILTLASILLCKQFTTMKLMKTVQTIAFLAFYIYALIVSLAQGVTASGASTLVMVGKIIIGFILCFNLLILIVRLFDLFGDASSTYGEKAKPIPPQKIKTRVLTSSTKTSKPF